ncbi:MAG: DUF3090 family protein [Acidimicrobiaceae bacterium]|nr:DUF3090 family protein [Acidimicrobiaceae bacterium]
MIHSFAQPDRVMVGARGVVGSRLFLLQVREGRRLVVMKVEKQQLAAVAEWIGAVLDDLGRPGHLPDDLTLESEYEPDFVVGEITLALHAAEGSVEMTLGGVEDGDGATVQLTREWAGALAIAITRLVEAGRAPCPLCGGPLDPRGHDCPRTNGHRAPVR